MWKHMVPDCKRMQNYHNYFVIQNFDQTLLLPRKSDQRRHSSSSSTSSSTSSSSDSNDSSGDDDDSKSVDGSSSTTSESNSGSSSCSDSSSGSRSESDTSSSSSSSSPDFPSTKKSESGKWNHVASAFIACQNVHKWMWYLVLLDLRYKFMVNVSIVFVSLQWYVYFCVFLTHLVSSAHVKVRDLLMTASSGSTSSAKMVEHVQSSKTLNSLVLTEELLVLWLRISGNSPYPRLHLAFDDRRFITELVVLTMAAV